MTVAAVFVLVAALPRAPSRERGVPEDGERSAARASARGPVERRRRRRGGGGGGDDGVDERSKRLLERVLRARGKRGPPRASAPRGSTLRRARRSCAGGGRRPRAFRAGAPRDAPGTRRRAPRRRGRGARARRALAGPAGRSPPPRRIPPKTRPRAAPRRPSPPRGDRAGSPTEARRGRGGRTRRIEARKRRKDARPRRGPPRRRRRRLSFSRLRRRARRRRRRGAPPRRRERRREPPLLERAAHPSARSPLARLARLPGASEGVRARANSRHARRPLAARGVDRRALAKRVERLIRRRRGPAPREERGAPRERASSAAARNAERNRAKPGSAATSAPTTSDHAGDGFLILTPERSAFFFPFPATGGSRQYPGGTPSLAPRRAGAERAREQTHPPRQRSVCVARV